MIPLLLILALEQPLRATLTLPPPPSIRARPVDLLDGCKLTLCYAANPPTPPQGKLWTRWGSLPWVLIQWNESVERQEEILHSLQAREMLAGNY